MRLKSAHCEAFQENITDICTDRLWKVAKEAAEGAPLPTMGVYITSKGWKTWWGRKKPEMQSLATAKEWSIPGYSLVGRKDRRLVIQLYLHKWECDPPLKEKRVYENPHILKYWDPHTFVTYVEIFPLTPQQAAFVGAKKLTSKSEYAIYWGTEEDVKELERNFKLGLRM